jgi:hypothetical protein
MSAERKTIAAFINRRSDEWRAASDRVFKGGLYNVGLQYNAVANALQNLSKDIELERDVGPRAH